MNIEDRIALAKDLIKRREEIDQQLVELFGGEAPKKPRCSICGSTEHTARTCPQKSAKEKALPPSSSALPSFPFDALSRLTGSGEGETEPFEHRPPSDRDPLGTT
ncbi:hypothetical protein LG047_14070 [Methylocystis sp. WRRC1]|uniref:hypothetical protein n=1 Tax=Methylocystis sp. WRRC1 TaxID=1732014 RepID=UPI001D15C8CD|nr:hypothetical protein [Methylocystis sp. WRRC1]MCC3246430.1 hypothetical protein [Methylocystis sp. WRRC1]